MSSRYYTIFHLLPSYYSIFHVTAYYLHYFLLRTHSGHTWRNKWLGPQETRWKTAVLYVPELGIAPYGSTRFISIGWVFSVLAQRKQCAPSGCYSQDIYIQHVLAAPLVVQTYTPVLIRASQAAKVGVLVSR